MLSLRNFCVAVGVGLFASTRAFAEAPAGSPPVTAAPLPMPSSSFLAGYFALTASDGTTVDSGDLVGQPYGVFFGFTHCPDICPTTLSDLTLALAELPENPEFRIYFITVDPERDTPEILGRYAAAFDPRIVPLSGSRAAVNEAIASFGIVAERTDLGGGQYVYGHTASVLLVDGDGLIVERTGLQDTPGIIADKLADLLGVPRS